MTGPIKSDFSPIIDALTKRAPALVVVLTLARLLPEMIKAHPKMAENLMWGFWEVVSEVLARPDVAEKLTPAQRVAGLFLTEYFASCGDWQTISRDLLATAAKHTGFPDFLMQAVSDRMLEQTTAQLHDFVEKLKQEGRWPPR